MNLRAIGLIAKSVLIEAVRRREVYAIVLVSVLLIAAVLTMDFFQLEGLNKFYREVALKLMGIATALTTIVLAARQLPREFKQRTIYPLLAKPISRTTFLAGKLLGVVLAAAFCFLLFMVVYVAGTIYSDGTIPWALFSQYVYLQMIMVLILATLAFCLSMVCDLDAAITISIIFYATASLFTTMTSYLFNFMDAAGQAVLTVLVYIIPQLTLFDLTGKTTHAEVWHPLSLGIMAQLTVYGLVFAGAYFALAALIFRRRAL